MTSLSDYIAQHDAEDSANAELLTQTREALDALQAIEAAEEAAYDTLNAEYAAYRAAHPDLPVDAPVIYGANYGFTSDKSRFGTRPKAARIYFQETLPTTVRSKDHEEAYAAGCRVFYVSHRDNSNARLTALCGTFRPDCTYYLSSLHEPEDDIADGKITLAAWLSRQKAHSVIVRAAGAKFGPTLMAMTVMSLGGRNPADYMIPGVYDFVGMDFYPDKGSGTSAAVVTALRNLAKSVGASEITVGEFGVLGGAANAVSLINDFHAAFNAKSDGPRASLACYWSTDVYVFTDATATAWLGAA